MPFVALQVFRRRARLLDDAPGPYDLETLRTYCAQIAMVDDGVGRELEILDRLDLSENTIVAFSADHGLPLGHHGVWGHEAATYPFNLLRAAHSAPLIPRHPASTAAVGPVARLLDPAGGAWAGQGQLVFRLLLSGPASVPVPTKSP